MSHLLDTKIEFLKGVGPAKAAVLQKELGIFTFKDLLEYYPFRYEDRTKFYKISEIKSDEYNVQIIGSIRKSEVIGVGRKSRLVAYFQDSTGEAELIWFQGVKWAQSSIKTGVEYVVYGKPSFFKGKLSIAHPEFEPVSKSSTNGSSFQPVYHSTEMLKKKQLDSKGVSRLQKSLLKEVYGTLKESLPEYLIDEFALIGRKESLLNIHFPSSQSLLDKARYRLKFEELFFNQLNLVRQKTLNQKTYQGHVFGEIPTLKTFYNEVIPFDLTNAQKRVIKEIRKDVKSGSQMNRLLQGDVGSGKTVVAFISLLMAIDNGAQGAMMAPTEILAEQHYKNLTKWCEQLNIEIRLLTGSTPKAVREEIHEGLLVGKIKLIVGTHALLENIVQFRNLGFCVIDEQHRFGVAQRAKLWAKNKTLRPHILVMTATPIPRTLAMTLYGDLDVSVIDELPPGRKPIKTVHRFDSNRLKVFGFMDQEIKKGRQVYVVYPLIEESEKLDLKDLMDGYESLDRHFKDYQLSIVHGKMTPANKEAEMQRFVKKQSHILVATTVIEVGVDVPNASVMVIENAERFGLAQLHQLRGRVGRGADQSYCILMSDYKLSKESKVRLETMCRTNNGFEIADVDLKLRGPGDMAGTRQSGVLDLKIADLAQDSEILAAARNKAIQIIEDDPSLEHPENRVINNHLRTHIKGQVNWSRIS